MGFQDREYTNRYKMLGWVGWRRSPGPGLGSVDVFPSFAWYSLWDWVKRRERSKEITEQKNLTKTKFVYDYLDGNKSHHYLVLVSSSQDILGTNAKLQSFQTEWKRHIYLDWRWSQNPRVGLGGHGQRFEIFIARSSNANAVQSIRHWITHNTCPHNTSRYIYDRPK
jgi:hypothetical protein